MLSAVSILNGFQAALKDKITDGHAHLKISNYDQNNSFEAKPIEKDPYLIEELKSIPSVVSVDVFATKAGVIKTDDQVEGIVLKGVDQDYNFRFLKESLIEGKSLALSADSVSNHILISKVTADKLHLKTGDKLRVYFIQDPPMQRSFTISGIFDNRLLNFAFIDMTHIQKLNDWSSQQIGGYEIRLKTLDDVYAVQQEADHAAGTFLKVETVQELHPQLFDWIGLFDMNVQVLIIISLIVCSVTMICCLLIIIIEKTNTIGILKALGANTFLILKMFINLSGVILIRGLVIGNLTAGTLCFIQSKTHFITLNPETYYVSYVPMTWSWSGLIGLNLLTVLICILTLWLPAYFIAKKITPIQAIRVD